MSQYICNICGEAISGKELTGPGCIDKSHSYTHWLQCSFNQKKKAYALLNTQLDSSSYLAGYGLRPNQAPTHNTP